MNRVALLVHESFRSHYLEGVVDRIHRWIRCPVGAEIAVGPGEILPIVDGEVHVMQCVVGGAVDELLRPMAGDHVPIVDQDGPDLDGNEEDHVQIFLHGANEDEETFGVLETRWLEKNSSDGVRYSLVWQRLHISIKRVESQCSPWCRNYHIVSTGTCKQRESKVEVGKDCREPTDPFVMRLVNVLVHAGVVLQAVDPVNGNIIESQVQYGRDQ